jgi:hypothetical protein
VLAYERTGPAGRRLVLANFVDEPVTVDLVGSWQILIATDVRREGQAFDGTLGGTAAEVLRPAD